MHVSGSDNVFAIRDYQELKLENITLKSTNG